MQKGIEDSLRAIVREEIRKAMGNQAQTSELLSRKKVAEILGIKENTLAIWASKNTGPAPTKIGSHVMYRRSELEAFIDKNTMPRRGKGGGYEK